MRYLKLACLALALVVFGAAVIFRIMLDHE